MFTFFWICFVFCFGAFLGCAIACAGLRRDQDDADDRCADMQKAMDKMHSELISKRNECELTIAAATRFQNERDAMEAMLDKYRCKTQELHELEGGKYQTWHAVN